MDPADPPDASSPSDDPIEADAALASADAAAPGPQKRMAGLDVARALAIVGMAAVHFGPSSPPPHDWLNWAYGLAHGRASLLFVLLAGIGLTLLAGHGDRGRWHRAWPQLASRVVILLPLGLALETLGVSPLVILQYYAVFFALAAPAVFLRDRVVLVAAMALAVVGPATYLVIGDVHPQWLQRFNPVTLGDPPMEIVREFLLTGSYPAIVWLAPFLLGMWLGRRNLRARSTRLTLLMGGATAAALAAWGDGLVDRGGWWHLTSTEPHSQMTLWLAGGTGTALATVGACLLLSDLAGRVMWPLVAMGQLALTLYVGHLLLLAAAPTTFTQPTAATAWPVVVGFAVGGAVFATLWLAFFARGPLETLMHRAGSAIARLLPRRESPEGSDPS